MDDIWHAVGALLVLVVPLVVAWWLLGRGPRPPRRKGADEREKMKR